MQSAVTGMFAIGASRDLLRSLPVLDGFLVAWSHLTGTDLTDQFIADVRANNRKNSGSIVIEIRHSTLSAPEYWIIFVMFFISEADRIQCNLRSFHSIWQFIHQICF
jgi:hypothetical protein